MGILNLTADERVAEAEVTDEALTVRLLDGRTISVPLVWYPRLSNATPEQRKNWQIAAVAMVSIGKRSTRTLARRVCFVGLPRRYNRWPEHRETTEIETEIEDDIMDHEPAKLTHSR